ncbi:MAG: dUTP diphosphatase [Corynebacteriales bacterium]|nr:dUTP diphosphatase [Mycobacteriales bacterium]
MQILLQMLDGDLPAPAYAQPGDAGADLCAAHSVRLAPGQRALVDTGVAVAIPDGYAGFVHPRSGLAHRVGLSMVNAPGTIDAGYRGQIKVNLINLDTEQDIVIAKGDRIAQLVIQPVARAEFIEVSQLPESVRGHGGHGSTGGHQELVKGV